jgi:hypothetical protein
MSEYIDTPRIRYEHYCIKCDAPATKNCRSCGLPLCDLHAKTGNNLCDSCQEDIWDENNYYEHEYR